MWCRLKRRNVIQSVELEHQIFKFKTLLGKKKEIYENAAQINFYDNIAEYFLENELMSDGTLWEVHTAL